MKVCMRMANHKEMVCTNGRMGQCIKANLKMVLDLDMARGCLALKVIKETISMTKEMAREYTNGQIKAIIKDNFWMI
jgi:hypothetical protein